MSGKGSKPRPYSVSQKQFASNWDKIFALKSKEGLSLPSAVDDAATAMAESARNGRT